MMRLRGTLGTALGSAFVLGGCGNIIGVGSLSSGGPDAGATVDAATGGRGSGGTAGASDSVGSGGRRSGEGGASRGALLDSGTRPVIGTSFDARAPERTADAGRLETRPGKRGIEDGGRASRDASSPSGDCVPGQSERWIPWSGVIAPDGAYVLTDEPVDPNNPRAGDYTFYICRARDTAGNVIPGTFVDNSGCFYTPDGTTQLQAGNFDVLADSSCLDFPAYSGSVPASAVKAGNLGQIPLYACAATPSQAPDGIFVAGYMEDEPNATCRVPYAQDAYDIPTGFWILTVD